MGRPLVFALAIMSAVTWLPAHAQQPQPKLPEAPRPAATFDAASIRRQAAQMAEFRGLLSDPDANVRLLTMREAIRAGDASQRQMAIDAGLASNETAMLELALRGILTNIGQIIIEFVDPDGKPTVEGGVASLRLTVTQFNTDTGRIEGASPCWANPKWSGQLQGVVFTFNADNNHCNGSLAWSSETGDFRGRVNVNGGDSKGNRNGVWRPR